MTVRDNHTPIAGARTMAAGDRRREPVSMAAIDPAAERPLGRVSPRQVLVLVVASAVMVGGLVVIAPAVADLPDVAAKLADGSLGWLTFALVLEALSFVGHAILFRAVSIESGGSRIGFRASTEIT